MYSHFVCPEESKQEVYERPSPGAIPSPHSASRAIFQIEGRPGFSSIRDFTRQLEASHMELHAPFSVPNPDHALRYEFVARNDNSTRSAYFPINGTRIHETPSGVRGHTLPNLDG